MYPILWIIIFVIHLQDIIHLSCFYFLAIENKSDTNIPIQVFLGTVFLLHLLYISGSGTDGSYGNCMFNLLRNYQIVFNTDTYPPAVPECFSFIFPKPTLVTILLIMALSVGKKWQSILIGIILVTNNKQFVYMFSSAAYIFPIEKCLCSLLVKKNQIVLFILLLLCRSPLCVLDTSPL